MGAVIRRPSQYSPEQLGTSKKIKQLGFKRIELKNLFISGMCSQECVVIIRSNFINFSKFLSFSIRSLNILSQELSPSVQYKFNPNFFNA